MDTGLMGVGHFVILFVLILLQFLDPCFAQPLCADSRAPVTPSSPLQFCSYNGTSCCSNADDLRLRAQFESLNISNSDCGSLLRSIICARCDPFSAELFRIDSVPREVPALCNSTFSSNSTQSNQATNDFCSQVWDTCQNVSMLNSPFAVPLRGGVPTITNSTRLTDLWQSQTSFCNTFGRSSDERSACYGGEPVTLNRTTPPIPPSGMCLEKIGNGSYLNMVAHPDGSNRAFFANQQGKIWLATIPTQGSGEMMGLDEVNAFLDLTDEVQFGTEFGMMGIAFHPRFTENGRLFASFNCDKSKWPECSGRCACNSEVNCDPSTLSPDNGALPCQYQSVIAEYTVNGTGSNPSSARTANPSEVRRIFTMGLPYTAHHAGQILFGPEDGYLYFMMGDGGGVGGDPHNFAQNKKSLLGKIMRFDIDNIPSAAEVDRLGLWGNYSIPNDNPFAEDSELQREIWAIGLRNPWRCSFDSARSSYFMCADVGQDQYEEVDLITKDGNYGWRTYEGPYLFTSPHNNSVNSTRPIPPVMGYNHSEVNKREGSASITGGYFYRSMTDPCMHGRYLYADLYGSSIWAGAENPINSGNFNSSKISFSCAHDSPLNCTTTPGSSSTALNIIFSFGEDNNKDIYILVQSGVYRIVRPSRCNYMCATENASSASAPDGPTSSPRSDAPLLVHRSGILIAFISFLCVLLINRV